MEGTGLGVLSSTKVLLDTEWVRIDREAVRRFAESIDLSTVTSSGEARFSYEDWTVQEKKAIVFSFNAINFCFWAKRGQPRWMVREENHKELDGSAAAQYCLERAYRQGTIDLTDSKALTSIGIRDLSLIFRSDNSTQIPMLKERVRCLNEFGQGLQDFSEKAIPGWEESAVKVVQSLALHVPNFNDVDQVRGDEIRFYKRAQLAAKMIHEVLEESGIHAGFSDLDELTAFADYRVPQILREKGILVYDPFLANRIDNRGEIEARSYGELAIRANNIWAAEYIRRDLESLNPGQKVTAADVDSFLWLEARRLKDVMRPHHRTRTIYY